MPYENFGAGEQVNLANGGLVIAHPSAISLPQNMGGVLRPTRYYNSKISWANDARSTNDLAYGPLGMGWTISYGRIFLRFYGNQDTGLQYADIYYSDESGAEHRLYWQGGAQQSSSVLLHPGTGWYFTNDSSFIRAYYQNSGGADTGLWYLYFPDGSIRVAGETAELAYIAPQIDSGSPYHLSNKYTNGWYVDQIRDRVGNIISIRYMPYSGQPFFGGAIDTITDQSGRTITFNYDANNMLASIQSGSRTESYTCSQVDFHIEGSLNVLTSVTDPAGLTTGYAYTWDTTASDDTHLTSISYPTGAVSAYAYTYAPYMTPTQVDDNVLTHTLSFHALDPSGALSGTLNVLAWTFDWPTKEVAFSTRNLTHAVIVTDPLGQETVHLITDGSGLDAGKELVTLRLSPGAVFDSTNPTAGRVYEVDKWYSHGDNSQGQGDAHSCLDDDTSLQVAQGNPRVRLVTETEYGGSVSLWTKTQTNQAWDGFGNYLISEVTGTAISEVVTASAYDLTDTGTPDLTGTDPATVLYQLDHRQMQYAGTSGATMTNSVSTTAALAMSDTQLSDPDPTGTQPFSGQFKAQQASYNGPGGLLHTFTAYEPVQGSFTFDFDHHLLTPVPSPSDGDGTQSFTYDSSGNIASIAFSGGEGGHGYTKNFTWQYGVLQQESWSVGPSEISYDSFTRGIDQATGRIIWERDPNGNQTNYSYDGDGRITAITPQWSGENGISVAYPNAHTIQYYKGAGSNPQIDPGGTASLADPMSIYTVYSFDDLGRPWRTDTVMPGGPWSEKVTLYGPTGAAMFSSLPYTYGGATTQYTVNGLANSSQFTTAAPAGSAGLAYGTWSVPYSGATGTAPSGPFPGQTSLDPFYRTMEVLGPDGSHTDTTYSGLSSYVTVNNVNGDPVSGTGTSGTTTYTKDVLGELLSVSPPAGAAASYGYDGLQHLHTVTQGSQPSRIFTYDALGHLRSAQLPESGLSSYTQYDAMGNLVQYTDGASQTFTKTYDSRGRQRSLSLGSTVMLQWFYDEGGTSGYGRLTRADSYINADNTAQVEEAFTYDGLGGRLGHESLTLNLPSLPAATYTASLSYDPQGQVTNETDSRGSAFAAYTTTQYGYGGLPSLKRFGSSSTATDRSGVNAISYWPSGAVDVLTFDNGTTTTFTQDPSTGRLAELRWQGTGNSWDSGAYQYDGIGEVTRMGSDSFSYDVTGRLTGATIYHPHTNGTSADFGYTYDPYGNLQTVTSSSASFSSLTTFGVDGSTNRLTSITGQTYTPSYDANGNMTNDGVNALQYDQLNRVTSLGPAGGSSTTYYYDAAGERVAVVNGNSATYFFRIGPQVRLQENFANAGDPSQSYAKTFLYVGGHLAASEEGNVAGGGTGSYTISGAVTLNGSGLPGVTVTAGSASATTQSDGSYALSGLAAGTYTVTPSLSGYTFSPASQSETITNANITTVNFAATASPSGHAIKGTVTLNGSGLGGVTITVTPNVQNYTITASAGTGGSISPSGSVQVASGSSQTFAIAPTGGYQIASVSVDGAGVGAVSTYAFTNVTANHTISASFSPSAGSYSISGTITYNGAGLSGVTVSAGSGTAGTTNASGAYTITGLSAGTYAVTPSLSGYAFSPSSASKTINNANITGVNFTASAVSGGSYSISGRVTVRSTLFGRIITRGVRGVTVRAGNASAITDFQGNYTISRLTNGTYSVTAGTLYSPSSQSITINGANVTGVNFTSEVGTNGPVRAEAIPETSVITNADGTYTVSGLADGSYTVTPSLSGYTFSPASQSETVSGADVTGVNFSATSISTTYSISGTVGGAVASGVTVALSGTANAATTTDASGNYSFSGLANGTYTVTPTLNGYTFSPASQEVRISGADQMAISFTATAGYAISGTVTQIGGGALGNVVVAAGVYSATTDRLTGAYTITGVPSGNYTVVPTLSGYSFSPASTVVTLGGSSVQGINFTGAPISNQFIISGHVKLNGQGNLAAVLVSASPGGYNATTDSLGNYHIQNVPNGTYTLNPSYAGLTFDPASIQVFVGGANVASQDFNAISPTYQISGTIASGGNPLPSVGVLVGASATYTNSSGAYSVGNLVNGTYTVSPSLSGYTFSPPSQSVTISGANKTGVNFNATATTQQLLQNPGFESGTSGWTINTSPNSHIVVTTTTAQTTPHSGYYMAILGGGINGGYFSGQTDVVKQTVTIPATATTATLSFWVAIYTQESGGTPKDYLYVQVLDTSGNVLQAPVTLSNLNASSWMHETASIDVSSIKGQAVQIRFKVVTSANAYGTAFVLDDTALTVTNSAQVAIHSTLNGETFGTPSWPTSHGGHGPNARFDSEGAYGPMGGDAAVGGEGGSRAEDAPAIPGPVVYYYVWDQVGSVRMVANGAGVIVETHDYSPYGQEMGSPACPSASLIHYAGQERDYPTSDCSDTVDSMHFRSYGALIGRFYKPDNVMGNPMNPQSWNLYSYVQGNPVGASDPTGHWRGLAGPAVPYLTPQSFGMSWYDQFSSAWQPWGGQTGENSWYWGSTQDAGVHYYNLFSEQERDKAAFWAWLKGGIQANATGYGINAPAWVLWACADPTCERARQAAVNAAIIDVAALFVAFNVNQPPPSAATWTVTYANGYNTSANAETSTEYPYSTTIFNNIWMISRGYAASMGGWGSGVESFASFNNLNTALDALIIHEYQHHLHPSWDESSVERMATTIFSTVFGYDPWGR